MLALSERAVPSYHEWSRKAQDQMIAVSRENMVKRLEQITEIVSLELRAKGVTAVFALSECEMVNFFDDVKSAILSWKGVDLSFCASHKTDFEEYSKTSMNWFNRNKAKIYGNHFFYPLIFVHVLNVHLLSLSLSPSPSQSVIEPLTLHHVDGQSTIWISISFATDSTAKRTATGSTRSSRSWAIC